MNCNSDKFESSLNYYLGNACLWKTGVKILADLVILLNSVSIITVPVRVPTADDTKSVADWISFLFSIYSLLALILAVFLNQQVL